VGSKAHGVASAVRAKNPVRFSKNSQNFFIAKIFPNFGFLKKLEIFSAAGFSKTGRLFFAPAGLKTVHFVLFVLATRLIRARFLFFKEHFYKPVSNRLENSRSI